MDVERDARQLSARGRPAQAASRTCEGCSTRPGLGGTPSLGQAQYFQSTYWGAHALRWSPRS
eukprot:11616712-Alexandrium_andersonii.AAC.1